MRLEITIEGGKPFHFPITKDVVYIGSSAASDIKIPQMHMSRKHLAVHVISDKYYIEDLGSTNGSYVNDERLEPLVKREFTSFFPVRLGSVVFLALVPDEEEDNAGPAADTSSLANSVVDSSGLTSTRVMDPGKLKSALEVKEAPPIKRGAPVQRKPKPKSSFNSVQIGLVVMALLGGGYFVYHRQVQAEEEARVQAEIAEAEAKAEAASAAITAKPAPLAVDSITDEDFVSRANMETVLARVKCVSEPEILLCDAVAGARGDRWGATVLDEQMIIAVDGTAFYNEAKKVMPVPDAIKNGTASVAQLDAHDDSIWKLASALFVRRSFSKMPFDRLGSDLLVIGLYYTRDSSTQLGAELVAQADQIQKVSTFLVGTLNEEVKKYGPQALEFLNKFYKVKASEL